MKLTSGQKFFYISASGTIYLLEIEEINYHPTYLSMLPDRVSTFSHLPTIEIVARNGKGHRVHIDPTTDKIVMLCS